MGRSHHFHCKAFWIKASTKYVDDDSLRHTFALFKELIQNAEDAGATEVKFLYDETEYGLESLWSPDMAQHQGQQLVTVR